MPLLRSTRRLEILGLASATARLSRAMQRPDRAQHRVLRSILESLTDTELGRRHRLAGVDGVAAFRDRVPPVTRDEQRFDLERTVAGERDVIVPGRAVAARATMSSPPRGVLIPVTLACRGRGPREAAAAWASGVLRRWPRILGGEVLVLPAVRSPASQAARAISAGTRLGHLLDSLPTAMRRRLAIPAAISATAATVRSGEAISEGARRRLAMRLALTRDVRLVIGGDPAEVATCFGAADEVAEAIIRDVRDGTFDVAGDLPRALVEELRRRYPPDRDRARTLDRGRDVRDGRLLPAEAWALEAVACLAQGREVTLRARLDPWLDPWRRGTGPVVVDLGVLTAEAHLVQSAVVVGAARPASNAAVASSASSAAPEPMVVGAASAPLPVDGSSGEDASAAGALGRPRPRPWMDEDPIPGPLLAGGGPPALESAFHEYVDLAEAEADPDAPHRWQFIEVGQLRAGRRYATFVTTTGGLLRCETRDLVDVVGRTGATPHLQLCGRTRGLLDPVP